MSIPASSDIHWFFFWWYHQGRETIVWLLEIKKETRLHWWLVQLPTKNSRALKKIWAGLSDSYLKLAAPHILFYIYYCLLARECCANPPTKRKLMAGICIFSKHYLKGKNGEISLKQTRPRTIWKEMECGCKNNFTYSIL